MKMETQKIVNLLNSPENEYSKLAIKRWHVIDSESKSGSSHEDLIKFLTKSTESSLCDYSDAYILVTRNITVTKLVAAIAGSCAGTQPQRKQRLTAATRVAYKNCAPFKNCRTEINDTFVDYADFINITMPMYNLIKHNDNYSDTSGSLRGFKRDDITNNANVTNAKNAPSKQILITNTETDGTKKGGKIDVSLKYLSIFWR